MKIEKGSFYTKEHEWVKLDGDEAYIGISDHAQHSLGDIVFVDMPDEGDEFERGEAFGAVESVKAASDIFMPIGGEVIEVNEEVSDNPALVNEDPYANWIIKIKVGDESEKDELMDAEAYEKFCGEEE